MFNRGTTSVNLTGWSVQYASATGTSHFTSNVTNLSGTLAPGQYYLVQEAGGTTGSSLPTADASGTINLSASAGKIIVANTTAGIGCNGGSTACTSAQLAQIVDLVGYGGANFYEGTGVAPGIDATHSDLRASAGCADTNNNFPDFSSATPTPRNTGTPLSPCGGSPSVSALGSVFTFEGFGDFSRKFTFSISPLTDTPRLASRPDARAIADRFVVFILRRRFQTIETENPP